jgi:hypothetical protein
MSEQREQFEALAREIRAVIDKSIEDGIRPSMVISALFSLLSYVVANTNSSPTSLERIIADGAKRVVPMALEARKAAVLQ